MQYAGTRASTAGIGKRSGDPARRTHHVASLTIGDPVDVCAIHVDAEMRASIDRRAFAHHEKEYPCETSHGIRVS
jgi:hypothetical protein